MTTYGSRRNGTRLSSGELELRDGALRQPKPADRYPKEVPIAHVDYPAGSTTPLKKTLRVANKLCAHLVQLGTARSFRILSLAPGTLPGNDNLEEAQTANFRSLLEQSEGYDQINFRWETIWVAPNGSLDATQSASSTSGHEDTDV